MHVINNSKAKHCFYSIMSPVSRKSSGTQLVHKLRTRTSEPYKRLIHDLKQNRQTNNKWIKTAKQQLSNHYTTFRFWWPITSQQNWPIQTQTRGINTIIWRWLCTWLWRWLPLRKSKTQSPTTSKDYPHLGDHAKQRTDTPGFKPFTREN